MADKQNEHDSINWNCEEYSAVKSAFNNVVEVISVIDNENLLTDCSEVPTSCNSVHIQTVDILKNPDPLQQVFMPQNVNPIGQQALMTQYNESYSWANNNTAQFQGNVSLNVSVPANPLEVTRFFHDLSRHLVQNRVSVHDFNAIKNTLAGILPETNETDKEKKLSIIKLRVAND